MRGQIWWFSHPQSIDVRRVVHDLDRRGLRYRHPSSTIDCIRILNDDGTTRDGSIDELVEVFNRQPPGSADLWVGPNSGVGFSPDEGLHRLVFDLDGLTWAEAHHVAFSVLACALGTPGTTGVVVDRNLPDNFEAWIDCIEKGGEIPYEPDLLLLTSTAGNHNHALILSERSWVTNPPQPTPEVPNP